MSRRALIFDCDGVLADTERDGHLPAFNQTFKAAGLPVQWGTEEYGHLVEIGGGKERMATLFDGPLKGTMWDHGAAAKAETLAKWHADKTRRYVELVEGGALPGRAGIHRLAAEADEAGWLLAVASTSAEPSVRAVLTHVVGPELASRFRIFAGDIVAKKKPSPDIYQLAVSELAVEARDVIVIEDSAIGCEAACAAGLTVVITVSTYTASQSFAGAALVVSSLGDSDSDSVQVLGGGYVKGGLNVATSQVTVGTLEKLLAE